MADNSTPTDQPTAELIAAAAAALALLASCWCLAAGAAWTFDGTIPPAVDSVAGTARVVADHRWSRPATAYDPAVRRHMPTGSTWWLGAGLGLATAMAFVAGTWRRLDVLVAHATLGRRPYDLRGARPRPWARPRDAAHLTSGRRAPDRFSLGTLDGRQLMSDIDAHVAVIAPTRAGKTTRCVIPWLLEHNGPAIVTSTKTDVLLATRRWRERLGRVVVWDPFGERSDAWTPLSGCEDWSYALRQAQWLADAAREGESEIASYWRGEAARLLAPLLHAAAVMDGSMTDVLSWVDGQEVKRPVAALRAAGADPAVRQLSGILELDPRNRGTIYMSAGSLIGSYRFPEVQATASAGLTVDDFLDGNANTLYVVAASREQQALAPLVVGLVSSLLHGAAEQAKRTGPLRPTLRVLLDEAANIAPLRDLPGHLSQAAGHGIRMATIWQSVAQLHHRYDEASDDILANSTAKLFMGPITDERTRRFVVGLLGERTESRAGDRPPHGDPKADAAALQQLARDRALLVEGRTAPLMIRVAPWWRLRPLARRGTR